MRLFVAVGVPDRVRSRLKEAQQTLRRSLAEAVRWVRPEAIHLTLKFLGSIEAERLPAVREALAGVDGEPFSLEVLGIGGFPGGSRSRVIWAGCSEPTGRLAALRDEVEGAMAVAGFEREPRAFDPHITLGRSRDRRGVRGLRAAAEPLERVSFGSFEVTSFELMESVLRPTGAEYSVAGSWELAVA